MPTIEVTRVFDAPPDRVYQAWTSAEHIRRWFSPEGCSVPEAEVDCRPGGRFVVCMRMPDGSRHWARGVFDDVARAQRLVFTLDVEMDGATRFTARTRVTFEKEGAGTRLTVQQDYTLHDPAYAAAPAGAREGWRTTLDKLAREIAEAEAPRGVAHGAFTLRRDFKASPAQLYHAISDPEAKARWFAGGEGWTLLEREMDVRPGGRERLKARWANGVVTLFDAIYFDVAPGRRLVYAYDMHLDERKLSVSLATLQVEPREGGSRLIVTEQGVFLDGPDDGSRERGTAHLVERIAASLGEPVSDARPSPS